MNNASAPGDGRQSGKAEERLNENESRFAVIFEKAPLPMALSRREDGRLVDVNERWVTDFGYSKEEAIGRTTAELGLNPDSMMRSRALWELAHDGSVRDLEVRAFTKSGEIRTFSSNIETVDLGGEKYLLNSAQDITGRKQREDAAERTRSQAERASGAKSEFLAQMSHEIRTQIGAVIGLADVLLPRVRDPEQQRFVRLIQDSARSLVAVVGEILDLSRIEAGQVKVDLREFGIRGLVERLVSIHSVQAAQRGLSLEAEIADGVPPWVRGDPELVGQVLRNLVSNAIKYTERGSVKVIVRARQAVGAEVMVTFEVVDTGIGIPADRMERLFLSFSRVHTDLLPSGPEGTGIGLAISKKLAELMGGEVGVESEPGAGSTFRFAVPLQIVGGGVPRGGPDGAGPDGQPLAALPPLKVLLAEDNRFNRLFLETAFRDGGHEIVAAENGLRAVELARQGSFDVVLMDIQMPEMDGLSAAAEIRRMPGRAGGVPLIALSAYAVKGDERRFLQSGMDDYVSKPVDFARLAAKIRRVCCEGQGRRAQVIGGDAP